MKMTVPILPIVLLITSVAASADELPLSFIHTGHLLDANDKPVSGVDVAMSFKIWNSATGADAANFIWPPDGQSAACPVKVLNGYFGVTIGSGCGAGLTTAHLTPGAERFLELSIDGKTLTPRLRIATLPTAMLAARALSADRLGTLSASDFWKKGDDLSTANFGGDTFTAQLATLVHDDDPRLSDARAPKPGSAQYVQIGAAQPQAGGFAVDGAARVGSLVVDGSETVQGTLTAQGNASFGGNASVTGNAAITGNGSVKGNLDVNGVVTASGFGGAGVLGLANGGLGTNATTFPPHALPVLSGNAFAALAPGVDGSLLSSVGGDWKTQTPFELKIARRTTAPMQLYVNSGGDDERCNGTAAAAFSSGAAPACAVASVGRAVDLLPEFIDHGVTIDVAAGTYYAKTASPQIRIQKVVLFGVTPVIRGTGTVILSGAQSTAPTTRFAVIGLHVSAPTMAWRLENLVFENYTSDGIQARVSNLALSGVTSRGNGGSGLSCQRGAVCAFEGTNGFSNNLAHGITLSTGATLGITGDTTATSNGGIGLILDSASTGSLNTAGSLAANTNGSRGLVVSRGSTFFAAGPVTLTGNLAGAVIATERATVTFNDAFTASVTASSLYLVHATSGSMLNFGGAGNVSVSCNSGNTNGIAILADNAAILGMANSGTLTLTNCENGVVANWYAQILDAGSGGAHTMTNVATPFRAQVMSTIQRGRFGALTSICNTGGSQCN